MSFLKDEDLQIKVEKSGKLIHIYAYNKATKEKVRLGHVQGRQHVSDVKEIWVSDNPDPFIAEKVKLMVHRVLTDIQDLT